MTKFIVLKYNGKYYLPTTTMVHITQYGTTVTTDYFNSLERLVGNIMSTPPTEWDGLFILMLGILIVYMFSYIRRHK